MFSLTTPIRSKPDPPGRTIVHNFQRLLLNVPKDSSVIIIAIPCKRQTNLRHLKRVQNPFRAKLYHGATIEVKRHRRDRHRFKPGEIKTRVQDRDGRRILVLRHLRLERASQRRVGLRREARDDGTGVDQSSRSGEHRLRNRQFLTADGDSDDVETVEGCAVGDRGDRSEFNGSGDSGGSEGEMTGVASGGREAVGEDLVVGRRRLRRERELVTAKAEKSGDSGEESLVVLAAAEVNAVEYVRSR